MTFEQRKATICDNWESIMQRISAPAKTKVNGKTSYICPLCGHGKNGDGLTFNKRSDTGQGLKCFGCGYSGNVIDLFMKHRGITFTEAMNELSTMLGLPVDGMGDFNEKHDIKPAKDLKKAKTAKSVEYWGIDNTEYYKQCTERLKNSPDAVNYLKRRGISLETAVRYGIGYDPEADPAGSDHKAKRLIMPTSKSHYVGRRIEQISVDKYAKINNKGGTPGIFNKKALYDPNNKAVFVLEGIFDALSVIEAGGAAIALNSTSNKGLLIEALKNKPTDAALILCLDNDGAGKKAQDELEAELYSLSVKFIKADITNGEKDANDAIRKDREAFTEAVRKAKQKVDDIERFKREKYKQTFSAGYFLQDFINGIGDSVNTPAIQTGFKRLDRLLDGGLYEGLYIIGAVSSLGKTTLMLQVLDQIAEAGHDVLIFSLEMAKAELMAKSISRQTLINGERRGCRQLARSARGITDGKRYAEYTNTIKGLIEESIQSYQTFADHIYIFEGVGDITSEKIRQYTADHVKLTGNSPVILVDYLQIVAPHNDRATERQVIDHNVIELKRISRDFKIPVIGISSFNRTSYSKDVSMEAFKESGAVEYSADVLIGLQYKGVGKDFGLYEAMKKRPREIELRILKNRNGCAGNNVQFNYFPVFNYFTEVEQEASAASETNDEQKRR